MNGAVLRITCIIFALAIIVASCQKQDEVSGAAKIGKAVCPDLKISLLRLTVSASTAKAALKRQAEAKSKLPRWQPKAKSIEAEAQAISGPIETQKFYAQLVNSMDVISHLAFEDDVPDSVVTTATTDVNGKWKMKDVPPGNYYLYAGRSTGGKTVVWLVPVSVPGNSVSVDLSDSNALSIEKRNLK